MQRAEQQMLEPTDNPGNASCGKYDRETLPETFLRSAIILAQALRTVGGGAESGRCLSGPVSELAGDAMRDRAVFAECLNHLLVEGRDVVRFPAGNQPLVDHHCLITPVSASVDQISLDGGPEVK